MKIYPEIKRLPYKELQEQCDKYGIVIRSEKDVIDRSRGIKWNWQQCSRLFEIGIRSIEDGSKRRFTT